VPYRFIGIGVLLCAFCGCQNAELRSADGSKPFGFIDHFNPENFINAENYTAESVAKQFTQQNFMPERAWKGFVDPLHAEVAAADQVEPGMSTEKAEAFLKDHGFDCSYNHDRFKGDCLVAHMERSGGDRDHSSVTLKAYYTQGKVTRVEGEERLRHKDLSWVSNWQEGDEGLMSKFVNGLRALCWPWNDDS
jgi:hypothetical protein